MTSIRFMIQNKKPKGQQLSNKEECSLFLNGIERGTQQLRLISVNC